ncbi:MAG: glycosyltransferase family protein [Gemmatimonadaceae bacterium]
MRVFLVGARNPWRMEAALQRALERAGHRTQLFDDRSSARLFGRRLTQARVLRAARRFRPEFIVLSKCLRLDLETVRALTTGVPNAMWYHDPQWHRDLDRPDIAHIANVGRLADVFYITGFVEEWRAHGRPAEFLPAAGAAEIIPVTPSPQQRATVAFIGGGYDPSRAEFLREVAAAVDTRVYGPGWEPWRRELQWSGGAVAGRGFAAACSSADFTLGILPSRASGATTYASDRMWMVMLAGGLYLGPWAPGLDALLRNDAHCFWYRDRAHCVERIRELVPDAARRQRVREAGEGFVRAHHTYDARVPFLLERRPWKNPLAEAAHTSTG